MSEVTVHTTLNSVYEVDREGRRARRLSGKNEPTQHTGTDGEWQEFADVAHHPSGGLVIVWDEDRMTVTSAVVDTETRALTG